MKLVPNELKGHTLLLAIMTVLSGLMMAGAAHADVTGNIAVVSKYVLRGITNDAESDTATLQGGFDYAHSSGIYVGYWGSGLDYADKGIAKTGFENDIYGGYKMKAGPVDLNFGAIYYVYNQIQNSDGLEAVVGAGIGGVTFTAKYLTEDLAWGNKGDIYWTADYAQGLPKDFKLAGSLGFYTYQDKGEFIPSTVESSGFRHLNFTLSHPVGKSAADMSITYVIAGENRQGVDQKNALVLALSSSF